MLLKAKGIYKFRGVSLSCIVTLGVFQEYLGLIKDLLESRESRVVSLIFEVLINTSKGHDGVAGHYIGLCERVAVLQGALLDLEAHVRQAQVLLEFGDRLRVENLHRLAAGILQGYLLSSEAYCHRVS